MVQRTNTNDSPGLLLCPLKPHLRDGSHYHYVDFYITYGHKRVEKSIKKKHFNYLETTAVTRFFPPFCTLKISIRSQKFTWRSQKKTLTIPKKVSDDLKNDAWQSSNWSVFFCPANCKSCFFGISEKIPENIPDNCDDFFGILRQLFLDWQATFFGSSVNSTQT